MSDRINDLRREAAEAEFQSYEFGSASIEGVDGWEFSTKSNEWTRALYFEPTDNEVTDADDTSSIRGNFTVVFSPDSDNIVAAYASINGNDIGARAAASAPKL